MPSIELEGEQLEILEEYLQRILSDLSVEIAGTDRQQYREEIKYERRVLEGVLRRLSRRRAEEASKSGSGGFPA